MQLRTTRAIALASALSFVTAAAAVASISTDERKRFSDAAAVVNDLRHNDNGIPDDVWSKAECVVVIPGMKKAAFIFGGEFGKGVMSCRAGDHWSAPAFMALAKGSWGFQAGAEEVDLVLLVMNQRGADKLLKGNVSLGADASIAAGPVGRTAAAATDANLSAEILAYSRAHGVFAGIDLSGGALKPDKDANTDVYGRRDINDVVLSGKTAAPAEASGFLGTLGTGVRATSGSGSGNTTDKY
jgi:lipid-binding SYLF domain-containing protein